MPSSPKRIVVTADVTRPHPDIPGEGATRPNARWLHALLAWPLSQACDLPVELVHWNHGFDAQAFYGHLGVAPTVPEWAAIHYAMDLPAPARAQILQTYRDSLVIGYEMAPSMIAVLHAAGIPVLDIGLGPLRFMDDLLCEWRSTEPALQQRIEPHRFDDARAWQQAGLLRAKMAWAPFPELAPSTALLIGQVGSDKAMIEKHSGRMLSFADYLEDLFDLAQHHDQVLYKPHPYEDRHGRSAQVMARFKSFRVTRANVYQLMCQPGLAQVLAISSGCVLEAPYFGKQGRHFYEPLHPARPPGPDAHGLWPGVPVDGRWLEPGFWREVLAPLVAVSPGRSPGLPHRANRLRRALNADWGYMAVDGVVTQPSPEGL